MMRDETLAVADIAEIFRLLPHRYPFLLIDRVIDMRGDEHGIGIKNLTMNEAQFAPFPEKPGHAGYIGDRRHSADGVRSGTPADAAD
jgi:3-hydroxyacyl-[acyl-carrier-protein] dehydratase